MSEWGGGGEGKVISSAPPSTPPTLTGQATRKSIISALIRIIASSHRRCLYDTRLIHPCIPIKDQ